MRGNRAKLHDRPLRSIFMQRSQSHQPVQPAVRAHRSAPVPLDPKDLLRVAGGAPRGGWLSTEVADTTQAPRGGWL